MNVRTSTTRWWLALTVTAVALCAPLATASTTAPVPRAELARIRAEYGSRYAYLPAFVPPGFIFTSWKIEPASANLYLPVLTVTFGRNGTLLIWSVFDARDRNASVDTGGDCSTHPYYTSKRTVAGDLVYYARGNHGDTAWTCLSVPTGNSSYSQPVGLSLWIGNDPGRPSAATAMKMVATARA
jgi:hypothetical protein